MSSSTGNMLPDLNKVMAAVGPQIFAFLPLGSLLSGSKSPMLVNTIFHDGVFQCLGQSETLSLSSCQHLRRINDDQLISLVRKIVEINEASDPGYNSPVVRRRPRHICPGIRCYCHIKVKHLDLSRCRLLLGEGVHYCLKHMPKVETILLSSAARFDAFEHFVPGDPLFLDRVEFLDMSECRRIKGNGIRSIVKKDFYAKIKHLDLSGCSALNGGSDFMPLIYFSNIESLNLAGTKVDTGYVSVLSYIHRQTLRCLNLRGCEKVNLPAILYSTNIGIARSWVAHKSEIAGGNVQSMISPYLVGSIPRRKLEYAKEMSHAITKMTPGNMIRAGQLLILSQELMETCESLDREHGTGRGRECPLFGRLEKLDIGMIGNSRIRLEGCIATIAWLNGGRLREVDLCGLESISESDLAVLALSNPHPSQLKTFTASATMSSPLESSLVNFFHGAVRMKELDLSCCSEWGGDGSGIGLLELINLQSIKLDYTKITDTLLGKFLAKSRRLKRLSVHGCSNVKSSTILSAKKKNVSMHPASMGLLELDCRDIHMDCPLSELREEYPTLLKLNNRSTPLGAHLLRDHRTDFLWRVGEKEKGRNVAKKRKRTSTITSATTTITTTPPSTGRPYACCNGCPSFINCCSIQRTGFSQTSDTEQEMFSCITCGIEFGRFVCMTCARGCHQDHKVASIGFGAGYCDCCIFGTCLHSS